MLQEGQQLGEFEILAKLGQGGMGAVYKARQTVLRRLVAIKTLQSSLSSDAEFVTRFHNEAVAAAGLNHPNLVQVYAAGQSDGIHWFAMEFVDGESVQARLKRLGKLEAAEALAKHQGQLSLDGLTTLSDKAADALAGYKGVILSLRGLESLEYAAAAALAKSGAWDGCLPTVRTLADAAVEALATRHFGVLDLGGLETLSTTAAITLSQTTAELRLLGLKKISNKAAKALVSRMHTTEISTTLWKSLSASNQNIGEAKPHLQVRRPGYVRGFT